MASVYEVRKKYGGVYVTIFPDEDIIVPWEPLSLSDYFKYTQDQTKGIIPIAQLEDEVFHKCVRDDIFIKQFRYLKAGIVATVVRCIWQASAPTTPTGFNEDIDLIRSLVLSPDRQIYNQLIFLITSAFPSYTPDMLLAKTYEEFLQLVVLSEERLITLGLLKERFYAQTPGEKPSAKKIDLKRLYEEGRVPDISDSINFEEEANAQDLASLDNHDRMDWEITKERLKQEKEDFATQAAAIYGDLINEMESKED